MSRLLPAKRGKAAAYLKSEKSGKIGIVAR